MTEPGQSAAPGASMARTARLSPGSDVVSLVHLPLAALVAWFMPERWWDAICRGLVALLGRVGIGRHMRVLDNIADLVDGRDGRPDARVFVPVLSANSHRARLHILRCYRPPEWRPQIDLIGVEHIESALHAGRGAILWVAPFIFSDLLTKMVLHRAGFQVAHLSRESHGFSPTRLGVRFLNPIWTHIENRYLAERLVMSVGHLSGALRTLVERVRQNKVVSVTVGGDGVRATSIPFLNGMLRVADGVPALALRTGAALLPVFTVKQQDGRFVTTVAPELRARAGGDAGVHDLMLQETALLESWVRRHPEQFVIWEVVRPSPPSTKGAAGGEH